MGSKKRVLGIYGILPASLETDDLLNRAEAALRGGVKCLQFRDKHRGFKHALKRAFLLRELTQQYQASFIINDSLQLALESGADGVHLGRDDLKHLTQVRAEVDDAFTLGVTCRGDAAFAKHVLDSGADYVSFGAVFQTCSKEDVPVIGLPRLQKARMLFPDANVCAIGGIDESNMQAVKSTGIDCIAMISGLFAADDIEDKARKMVHLWAAA
ncbi:MAG: thiamine phosphate synthase [Mariprofundaceae bacterium]